MARKRQDEDEADRPGEFEDDAGAAEGVDEIGDDVADDIGDDISDDLDEAIDDVEVDADGEVEVEAEAAGNDDSDDEDEDAVEAPRGRTPTPRGRGKRTESETLHTVAAREDLRRKLAADVEAFLNRGGAIQDVPQDTRAEPQKKPDSSYGRGSA